MIRVVCVLARVTGKIAGVDRGAEAATCRIAQPYGSGQSARLPAHIALHLDRQHSYRCPNSDKVQTDSYAQVYAIGSCE